MEARINGAAPRRTVGWVLATGVLTVAWLAACGGGQHVVRGDQLRAQGRFDDAIAAYEQALKENPDDAAAQEGIRQARRDAVAAELERAKERLGAGDYPQALVHALRAQRMPLDLDEVSLVRAIDDTIATAARLAEEQVATWSQQGLFLLAAELAEQVVRASPGVAARREWADDVRAAASRHFLEVARELEGRGLVGSAVMQLAMAARVGGGPSPGEIRVLWDRFTEPVCFAVPKVEIAGVGNNPGHQQARAAFEGAVRAAVDELRSRCGDGSRPLSVRIQLDELRVVDDTRTEQAFKAIPGSGVETVEVYYEERPYTVEEEVTEYEVRIEKQERRDCAPRPGKPRGCETWIEEVEVKIPHTKTVTRTEVERIKKTRPARGPFPEGTVVTYDVTTTRREVTLRGTVAVGGPAPTEPRPVQVAIVSEDSANPERRHPKVLVRADPMKVREMSDVLAEAASIIAQEVRRALSDAVAQWSRADAELARAKVVEGQLPEAEEIYLRLIALGATDNPHLQRFFRDRYGKPVGGVMDILLAALGFEVERRSPGDDERVARFPRRGEPVPAPAESTQPVRPRGPIAPTAPAASSGAGGSSSSMSAEELEALEASSLETVAPAAGPPEGSPPASASEDTQGTTAP